MQLSLIVAMTENRVIGKDNQLPWKIPADMRYFKQTTVGHPVIMGRKTFESLNKPLVDRKNIVLSQQQDWQAAGCTVVHSIQDALTAAQDTQEVFIIGGATIYKAFLPLVDCIYLTEIHTILEGDSYFPELNSREWEVISQSSHPADEKNAFAYTFKILKRQLKI